MNVPTSLIDLKAISEPASKLIDAVSSAIGVLYEPTRIRRKARADAEAAIIGAEASVQVNEIESRAINRLLSRETRRQRNIEAITRRAVDYLPTTVSPTPVDEDWMFQFFEYCSDVSNDEMQALWAQILSGEVADPGRFSLRTLNTVKLLRKSDAEDFFRLCTSLWQHDGSLIVVDSTRFIDFRRVLHLQSVGLAETNLLSGYKIEARDFWVSYHDHRFRVSLIHPDKTSVHLGLVALSASGAELASIVQTEPDLEYMRGVIDEWRNKDYNVQEDP